MQRSTRGWGQTILTPSSGTTGGVESSWTLQYCVDLAVEGPGAPSSAEPDWGVEAVPGPTTMDASGLKWQLLPPSLVNKVAYSQEY
jgi:hypothetical protein